MKYITLLIMALLMIACSCTERNVQESTSVDGLKSKDDLSTLQEAYIYVARTKMAERDYGTTPLMKAATSGNLARVKELVEGGADIGTKDDLGVTVIEWLSSILARSPENMKSVAETLRQAGMPEEKIAEMTISSTPPDLTEEDYENIRLVLEYLKEENAKQAGTRH